MSKHTHRRQRQQTRHRYLVVPRYQSLFWVMVNHDFARFMTKVHDAVAALGDFAKVATYTNEEWKDNREYGYNPQASQKAASEATEE